MNVRFLLRRSSAVKADIPKELEPGGELAACVKLALPGEYVNQTSNRQARTYGPLMGLFLASLLTKAVAKYTVPSFLPSDYNPFYLLHNNKPVNYISYNNAQYGNSVWHPIENPYSYGPSVHHIPSASPENFPDQYAPPIHQPPTFTGYNYYPSNPPGNGDDVYPNGYNQTLVTNIENPSDAYEPVFSASNINIRRQHPSNQKRRYNNFNQPLRYPPQNRIQYENDIRRDVWNRGSTPFQNYDSYDDYSATVRNQPIRRIKPYKRKPIINYDDYYYNDSDYSDEYNEESFEVTTRSNKRKRRPARPPTSKPKRKRNKNKKRKDSSEENIDSRYDESSSAEEPRTEIIIVKAKQRQASSTTEESTTFESTTTEGTTTTTESSNTTNAPGYETGYGPSNGNENISFTYGPPTLISRYQDYTPYINWYTQDNARNSIVKRVQDIVGFDANVVRRG